MGVLAAFEGPKVAWSSLSPLLVLLGGAMVLLVASALVPSWPRRLSSTFTALVAVGTFVTLLLMWHRVDIHGPVTLVGDANRLQQETPGGDRDRFQQQQDLQNQRQQEINHLQDHNEAYNHYNYNYYNNHYYGGYYGGSYMYYGGTWGGFYSGMMMGAMTGMMLGATMASLPSQYSTVIVSGQPYYYSNGAYLTQQHGSSGYTLVPPPPGAVVTYLPSNCAPVYQGPQTFDDCGGAFYQRVPGGYQVVTPPAGLEINHIPSGAVAHTIDNTQYFEYGGVWYQPFYGGSDVIYRIVNNPVR